MCLQGSDIISHTHIHEHWPGAECIPAILHSQSCPGHSSSVMTLMKAFSHTAPPFSFSSLWAQYWTSHFAETTEHGSLLSLRAPTNSDGHSPSSSQDNEGSLLLLPPHTGESRGKGNTSGHQCCWRLDSLHNKVYWTQSKYKEILPLTVFTLWTTQHRASP